MAGERRAYLESLPALLTKTDSPPPGGESANLVNWGLVHGEPTRSAHSKDFSKTEKKQKYIALTDTTRNSLLDHIQKAITPVTTFFWVTYAENTSMLSTISLRD